MGFLLQITMSWLPARAFEAGRRRRALVLTVVLALGAVSWLWVEAGRRRRCWAPLLGAGCARGGTGRRRWALWWPALGARAWVLAARGGDRVPAPGAGPVLGAVSWLHASLSLWRLGAGARRWCWVL